MYRLENRRDKDFDRGIHEERFPHWQDTDGGRKGEDTEGRACYTKEDLDCQNTTHSFTSMSQLLESPTDFPLPLQLHECSFTNPPPLYSIHALPPQSIRDIIPDMLNPHQRSPKNKLYGKAAHPILLSSPKPSELDQA